MCDSLQTKSHAMGIVILFIVEISNYFCPHFLLCPLFLFFVFFCRFRSHLNSSVGKCRWIIFLLVVEWRVNWKKKRELTSQKCESGGICKKEDPGRRWSSLLFSLFFMSHSHSFRCSFLYVLLPLFRYDVFVIHLHRKKKVI